MRELYIGLVRLAALAAFAAALGWNRAEAATAWRVDAPRPAATPVASTRGVDLEELFWRCDYAATVAIIDADEQALCTAVAEQLKVERFGGDFERMLEWWQVNKPGRHQHLERDDDSNAAE
ncbi:MAG TPA: hypothetical protein VLV56_18340 [Burkholderiales bacterium]|nr:hypothetical protein [Burkholderiales bacterium]